MVPASSWEVPSACQVGGGPRRISGTWNKHSHKKTKHLTNCMQICTNDEIAPNRAESKSTVWVIAACITPDKVCWLLPRRAAVLIHCCFNPPSAGGFQGLWLQGVCDRESSTTGQALGRRVRGTAGTVREMVSGSFRGSGDGTGNSLGRAEWTQRAEHQCNGDREENKVFGTLCEWAERSLGQGDRNGRVSWILHRDCVWYCEHTGCSPWLLPYSTALNLCTRAVKGKLRPT